MANVDAATGLTPVAYLSGAPYNGACQKFSVPATDTAGALYIGTPVKLGGTADATGRYATVTLAATTNVVVGVIVAVEPVTHDSLTYRANSTARTVLVATDPNLVYEIQEVSGGTALTIAAVGLNANWVGTSGSTITGKSSIELNNATEATTASLDCQIIGLVPRDDNELGEHAKWRVRLNNHQYVDGTTGVS